MKPQYLFGLIALSLLAVCGGRPNPGTKADRRLKENNPSAGKKPATSKPAMPAVKKGGGKS